MSRRFMLIDTHAHVNFNAFKDDADEVVKRTLVEGVFVINVGSQYSTSARAVKMANKYKTGVWAAVGLHPIHVNKFVRETLTPAFSRGEREIASDGENFNYQKYLELAKNKKVAAVGEMGLDHHHFEEGDNIEELKKKQKEIFLQGIKLANEVEKPMIVHCWDAYEEILEILRNQDIEKKGVIHSFIGGHKTAKKFTELGYKIGLNGIITYADDYNRLIKELNFSDIVLETDCPYLTPVPHKGERNEPLHVKLVAEKIAKIKGISVDELAGITSQNAKNLLEILN